MPSSKSPRRTSAVVVKPQPKPTAKVSSKSNKAPSDKLAAGESKRNNSPTSDRREALRPVRPTPLAAIAELPCIRVHGAREHNLKNIDVSIPRDRLVVITGLSGSGKSSLAFDTIFAEGQRKYMESLSAYARQFLDQLKKPDVDDIEGLPPTIAIEQRSGTASPRSTVATTTEIYDYLRLLYARCGQPRCWEPTKTKRDNTITERCGKPITATASTQIVDAILRFDDGARLMILAPIVRAKKGFHRDVLESLQTSGWVRARVNSNVVDLRDVLKDGTENPLGLGRYEKHDIDVVVDRVVVRQSDEQGRQRLAESVESALRAGSGTVVVSVESPQDNWTDHVFSENHACAVHPSASLAELSPRVFSFNSPMGACPTCHGLGMVPQFDAELVVPDRKLTLAEGAIKPWKVPPPMGKVFRKRLREFCATFGVSARTPFDSLSSDAQRILLHGTTPADADQYDANFEGVLASLARWYTKTESAFMKEWLGQYMQEQPCPTCNGDRLRIESLHVFLESDHAADQQRAFSNTCIARPEDSGRTLNIAELSRLTISDARAFLGSLRLTKEQSAIAEPIIRESMSRLGFLESVGLEYLSLDRKTGTLSGGEAQRIRLATQVGSKLVGACYVLDEPTIGLHPRDNDRLITTLRHLADIGNTVLVVEHDEEMIRAADHVLDVGPGPGVHGGRVIAQGVIEDLAAAPASLTGQYLTGKRVVPVPKPAERRKLDPEKSAVTVKGAKEHNLKNIDVAFPLGGIICVTGVSGSGKSTLVNDILLRALKREILGSRELPGAHARLTGHRKIDRVIEVDQSPIGRTPRSNPATYTGMFDEIRKIFTNTKEAKIRGYKPGRFSFNVPGRSGGGRCEACEGQGVKKIEMHFLADVFVTCEVCNGARYNRETLGVTYRGKHIADVLNLTVENACTFFENHPKILRFATCLRDVGLDYITLGQPSTTLSGGEAQRIKLATELGKGTRYDGTASSEHTLYILDEPTTGLHFEDVRKLTEVLDRLADAGNTLVVIEHNLDVIKRTDWIIDLGPEGGDRGGTLVAQGTPEQVAKAGKGHTAAFLAQALRQ